MRILLPVGIDYTREERDSGTIAYVFKHKILGVLGSLYLIPDVNGSRLSWEPYKLEDWPADYSPPFFIKNIFTEAEEIIKNLRSRPKH